MTQPSFPSLDALARGVAAIGGAGTASRVFEALLEAAGDAVPRAALWLRRGGAMVGWRSTGYPAAAAARLQGLRLSDDRGWPGGDGPHAGGRRYGPGDSRPWGSFGEPRAAESLVLPILVAGRPLAYLVVERAAGESPWSPEAVTVFAWTARLRLEVDLAFRKLRSVQQAAGREAAPPPSSPEATRAAAAAAPPVPPESALEETTAPEEDPEAQSARAFARLVATDIRLYNEEAVVLGRKHGDLASRLGDELERGEQTFRTRFPHLGERGIALLYDAYREVLAGGNPSLIPDKRVTR